MKAIHSRLDKLMASVALSGLFYYMGVAIAAYVGV